MRTNNINLDTLMYRLRVDSSMLDKHKDNPIASDLLTRRIERHKTDIINFLMNNSDYGKDEMKGYGDLE